MRKNDSNNKMKTKLYRMKQTKRNDATDGEDACSSGGKFADKISPYSIHPEGATSSRQTSSRLPKVPHN